jgi:capsular polysaccharide biosynthesis protein
VQRSVFSRVLLDSSRAVVIALVLGALVGLVCSLVQQPVYAATARIFVVADPDQKPSGELAAMFLSQRRARSYLALLTSPALLQRAATVHRLPATAEYLEKNLTITSPRDTSLIDVTATAPTGQLAADYADAIAQEFVVATVELEKKRAVHARVLATAAVPARPFRPQTAENMANTALALALAAAVANFYRARRNPKLSYLPNIRTIGDVPVIGAIAIGGRTYLARRRSKRRQTAQISCEVDRIVERLIAAGPSIGGNRPEVVSPDGRVAALMSEVPARRLTESSPTAGAATSQAAVGTAVRPTHVGIISAGSRWNEARRFAQELHGNDRQAVLVIAKGFDGTHELCRREPHMVNASNSRLHAAEGEAMR